MKVFGLKNTFENLAGCCLVVVDKKCASKNFLRILQRNHKLRFKLMVSTEAAIGGRYSIKKMFLKISQNSQESTCARASFLIKLQAWEHKWLELSLKGVSLQVEQQT